MASSRCRSVMYQSIHDIEGTVIKGEALSDRRCCFMVKTVGMKQLQEDRCHGRQPI